GVQTCALPISASSNKGFPVSASSRKNMSLCFFIWLKMFPTPTTPPVNSSAKSTTVKFLQARLLLFLTIKLGLVVSEEVLGSPRAFILDRRQKCCGLSLSE